jgi:glycosyltransferase involved in cell wall biosynthesis
MQTNQPKVSIITSCFNREKFIAETLACVQKIHYSNWECIVVDDGSTDNSAKIIQEFVQKDDRFKYLYHSNSGISITKNVAIANSSGKYIFPLDSDDLISPEYIPEAVKIMEKNLNVKVVYADGVYFGTKNKKWRLAEYSFNELLISNCIHNSAMFRRIDFDKTNGYDPELLINEDWDLWINILKSGGEVVKIKKKYFFYRKHEDSSIVKYPQRDDEMLKLLYQKNKDVYDQLLGNPIQLLFEHRKYRNRYNILRWLTFRKSLK